MALPSETLSRNVSTNRCYACLLLVAQTFVARSSDRGASSHLVTHLLPVHKTPLLTRQVYARKENQTQNTGSCRWLLIASRVHPSLPSLRFLPRPPVGPFSLRHSFLVLNLPQKSVFRGAFGAATRLPQASVIVHPVLLSTACFLIRRRDTRGTHERHTIGSCEPD